MTAVQIAEAISVSPRTVQNLWATGELPFITIKGKRRTLPWQLEQWLREQEQQKVAPW